MKADQIQGRNLFIAGTLILLAIITLAGIGLRTLRDDKNRITADAEAEAKSIATRINDAMQWQLWATIEAKETHHEDSRLELDIGSTQLTFQLDDEQNISLTPSIWESANPNGSSSLNVIVLAKNGLLIFPPPFAVSPEAPSLIGKLPLAQQTEWNHAIESLNAGIDLESTATIFQSFETNALAEIIPLAKYQHGLALESIDSERAIEILSACTTRHPDAMSESGLPLAPLARLHAARIAMRSEASTPSKQDAIVRLASAAVVHPSVLSLRLIENARKWEKTLPDQPIPSKTRYWQNAWEEDERRRQMFRRSSGRQVEWIGESPNETLLIHQSFEYVDLLIANSSMIQFVNNVIDHELSTNPQFTIQVLIADRSFGNQANNEKLPIATSEMAFTETSLPGKIIVAATDAAYFYAPHANASFGLAV